MIWFISISGKMSMPANYFILFFSELIYLVLRDWGYFGEIRKVGVWHLEMRNKRNGS